MLFSQKQLSQQNGLSLKRENLFQNEGIIEQQYINNQSFDQNQPQLHFHIQQFGANYINNKQMQSQATEAVQHFLSKSPSDQQLIDFLTAYQYDGQATAAFHQLDLQAVKQPTIVYVKLAVQDIRDNCYFYPYIIEKPFSQKSQISSCRYGFGYDDFSEQKLSDPKYFSMIRDRETIVCSSVFYETEWVKDIQKSKLKQSATYNILVENLNQFKLGDIVSAICMYQPQKQQLYFIRNANEKERNQWENIHQYLSKEIKANQTKEKIIKIFNQFFSERYSHFLLYSLISTERLFLSALENPYLLIEKLLPRVCNLQIKAPFKQSFFPYKNQDEIMVNTPMQMCSEHTYVILDFSNISKDSKVQIQNQQIDNLKALKVFVEDGNTIFRWLFGESIFEHKHTGLIVKASSIITPQYVIPQKQAKIQLQLIKKIQAQDLRQFRCYFNKVRDVKSIIHADKDQIQKQIKSQSAKFNETALRSVLELANLNAKSEGRTEIKYEDFAHGCKLYFSEEKA